MPAIDPIKAYLATVCDQIRWKKCHASIASELEGHLRDQRDALVQEGANEAEATTQAIAMMGDPVTVGTQLDRTHRPKPQWSMLILTILLVLAGTAIHYTAIQEGFGWSYEIYARLIITVAGGLAVLFLAYFSDFTLLAKIPKTLYGLGLLLFMATLVLLATINREAYIISTLSFSTTMSGRIHYATFLTLLFPVLFSGILYSMRGKGILGIVGCQIALLIPAVLALKAPSAAGFALIAVSGLIMLSFVLAKRWFSPNKHRDWVIALAPFLGAVSLLGLRLLSSSHIRTRFQGIMHPESDPLGSGYVTMRIRTFLQHSEFWGAGTLPDLSIRLSVNYLHDKDFLLTLVIFKTGWLVFALLVSLILLFLIKGMILSLKQRNVLGQLVGMSVILTFTFQFAVYTVYNMGFLFLGPISLPFISSECAPLMINLALAGLMLSVFRNGHGAGDSILSRTSLRANRFMTLINRVPVHYIFKKK